MQFGRNDVQDPVQSLTVANDCSAEPRGMNAAAPTQPALISTCRGRRPRPMQARSQVRPWTTKGVARGGVEPPTFRFSVGRSYQLSYLAEQSKASFR